MSLSENLPHIDLKSCQLKKPTENFYHDLVEAWICHKRIAFYTVQGNRFNAEHLDHVSMEGQALERVKPEAREKIILDCVRIIRENSRL